MFFSFIKNIFKYSYSNYIKNNSYKTKLGRWSKIDCKDKLYYRIDMANIDNSYYNYNNLYKNKKLK